MSAAPAAAQAVAPCVVVLMASYNGARNIREQLESIAGQSLAPCKIVVSDDESQDGTGAVVAKFAEAHPEIDVLAHRGPCVGAAQNFMSLLRDLPKEADYVALSDQDDVWLSDKLAVGVARLAAAGKDPALYCGRTWECDNSLGSRHLSRGAPKGAGFRHAMVQNIAGGNTMILNRAAAQIIQKAAELTRDVVVHDWWIYQVICAVDGLVLFDDMPHMLYRQHGQNVIGANRGLRAMAKRLRMLLSGEFRRWGDTNIAALRAIEGWMTEQNRTLLNAFIHGRDQAMCQRVAMLYRHGFYRQGYWGQMSLYLAALLKRL